MKSFITILILLLATPVLASNTAVYDDAAQTLTNKTITCTDNILDNCGTYTFEKQSQPSNPASDTSVVWMSNGTGFGDEGDIMILMNVSGTTRYATIVDFSTATGLGGNILLETGDVLLLETGDNYILED